ncbi:MAG TPA: hypothetical protein VD865_17385 [Stenotrophomonas sp.]|nr:hypothetical protein [Stenotrophomonas sp.]
MANRQTIEQLLDALQARIPREGRSAHHALQKLRFEQELEEVVQLADRADCAHFRDRIDHILRSRRH